MSGPDGSVSLSADHGRNVVQIVGHGNILKFIADEREAGREDPEIWLTQYLRSVYTRWQDLPLERLVTDAAGRGEGIKLPAVFTPLDVYEARERGVVPDKAHGATRYGTARSSRIFEDADADSDESGRKRFPVIAALGAARHVVLTGEPGGGKSSVARFVVVCNAGAGLKEPVDLDALSAAMQTDETGRRRLGDAASWPHPPHLPLYIELRRFASTASEEQALFPPANERGDASHFLRYLRHHLLEDDALAPQIYEALVGALNHPSPSGAGAGVLIILDGLDEVDEAAGRRERLKQVVERLADQYPGVRMIVTSRTYAYRPGSPWRLSERFIERELAPYTVGQMARYVMRWYAESAARRPSAFPGNRADEYAQHLKSTLERELHVRALGERPLLLAMITLLHDQRGGQMPRGGRTGLYDEAVALLTDRWINERGEPPLTDGFGLTLDGIRAALERVAFRVHAAQSEAARAADVPFGVLSEELERARERPDGMIDAGVLRRRLAHRAGILVSDDEEVYRFPHRSFQEYLAAIGLATQSAELGPAMPPQVGAAPDPVEGWTFPENLVSLLRSDPERWREVGLLVGGWSAKEPDKAWALIEHLLHGAFPTNAQDTAWWGAYVAACVLEEHVHIRPRRPSHHDIQARLRLWCAALFNAGALPPVDRAATGRALAIIGDDRPGVGCRSGVPDIAWFPPLDREPLPREEFWMGSDATLDPTIFGAETRRQAKVSGPFRISRHLITVAQYIPFVTDGYHEDRFWTAAGRDWRDRTLQKNGNDSWLHISNQPVTNVSWFAASAFCAWLSDRLGTPVRLPTETEWEYAARGIDGRLWPWGNEFDAERCNMNETLIGETSAVGLFPLPDGPWGGDGPLDMSGNVLEWCVSAELEVQDRESVGDLESTATRVLRGGSFSSPAVDVRCAFRDWDYPDHASHDVGFRIVAPIRY